MRLILVGFGVVGQSFAKLLLSRSADLYSTYGLKPRIVACIDSIGSSICSAGLDLQTLLDVKKSKGTISEYESKSSSNCDPCNIIENIDAEILLELTPTNLNDGEPGISHIISAMRSGKHVITVNKGPLAMAFPSLLELANYNGVMLRFSGTVGGGTPILDFAKRCLKGDRIISFKGILNGTTNYILSKMEEGLIFENALDDARQKGYAEAVPTLDIDGFDPKLCPNTGTPVPGGLEFHEFVYLLKKIVLSGRKVIGFDLSEVCPGNDDWDANVGARVLYQLCNWTAVSHKKLVVR